MPPSKAAKRCRSSVIRDAFQACQDSFSTHPQLVKKLRSFYDANDVEKFFEDFVWYLSLPISGITERSAFIDRTLEFVAKFACSFLEKSKNGGEESADGSQIEEVDEELPPFLYKLFAWLLDHHEAEGADVRLRVCQLLNKLLKYMGEDACIDDNLYNRIYDGMLVRFKDKVPEIRSQAVTALQRLQDPKDDECPIIKAYLFHLTNDPNNIVRRTIVRCIGATRLTLPHILERTRDVDEHVRRAAYKFLAEKVHIKSLTIGQREGLLQRGLGERAEAVRKVVEKELIPSWLRLSNHSIVQLLHHLDVGNSDQEIKAGKLPSAPASALEVLFTDVPYKDLVANFQYLDQNRLIPYEKLTAETAMYWRVLTQFLGKQEGQGAEEYQEQLLPELTQFCEYVRRYVLEMEKQDEDVNWEFVAKELIMMCSIYDLGDEVGRRNLCRLIKDLLISQVTPASFIPHLVAVFNQVERNAQSRIEQVAEVISELKDPMSSRDDEVELSPETLAARRAAARHTSASKESGHAVAVSAPDEEAVRRLKLEIAGLRVKIIELRDSLDEAINVQDFIRAQTIKEEMNNLEIEQQQLEAELRVEKERGIAPGQLPANCVSMDATSVNVGVAEAESETPDNPAVTLKCLRLLVATMQDPGITQLNATLHTLLEEFIIVSVKSEISHIRKEAIVALASCCLRSIDNARQHMLLLLQAAHIDVHEVKMAAIAAVIDLLMKHGLAAFITATPMTDPTGEVDNSRTSETASNIESALESDMATRGASLTQAELESQGGNSVVAILSKMLDEPDLDLRTEVAEGLCKLLMIGSISSPKLLSRLLLIWYNPMTESDSKLRHILGTFFPLYASMSKTHQLSLESAFIPTMKILFDAPVTSPLADIDTEDVGMFFVHLTREDTLQSYKDTINKKVINEVESSNTSVHDSLAFAVCNEILSSPDSFQTKVLIKILTNLQLTNNNFVTLRELKVLSEQLLNTVKEKSCVRSLERFDKIITDWLANDPSLRTGNTRPDKEQQHRHQQQKRQSDGDLSDQSQDNTQTPRKRRVLFSQSMIGNPLLNVEDNPAPATSMNRTGNDTTRFLSPRKLPSPVVPRRDNETQRLDKSTNQAATEQTLEEDEAVAVVPAAEGQRDDEGGESSSSIDSDSSSLEFNNILASTQIQQVSDNGNLAEVEEEEETFREVETTQVLSPGGEDWTAESDVVPETTATDTTSADEEEKEATPRRASRSKKENTEKPKAVKRLSRKNRIRAQSPPASSSQSSVASSEPANNLPRRRSAKALSNQTTKENALAADKKTAARKVVAASAPTSQQAVTKEQSPRGRTYTAGIPADKDTPGKKTVVSPVLTSRAGRKNSPRIDYRTGQRLEAQVGAGSPSSRRPLRIIEETGGHSGGRKRNNGQIAGNRSSSGHSPVLKKKPTGPEDSSSGRASLGARRSGRGAVGSLPETIPSANSDEDIIDRTPPNKAGRTRAEQLLTVSRSSRSRK